MPGDPWFVSGRYNTCIYGRAQKEKGEVYQGEDIAATCKPFLGEQPTEQTIATTQVYKLVLEWR
jgi:hypothetical protein